MTQKEATGDRSGGAAGGRTANPLLSLHCVLRWRYLPFYKSDRGVAECSRARRRHSSFHGITHSRVMSSPSLATCRLRRPVPFGRERVSSECEETIEFVIVTRQTEGRRERRRRRRQRRPRSPRISQSGRRTRARERMPRPPTLVGDPRRRP